MSYKINPHLQFLIYCSKTKLSQKDILFIIDYLINNKSSFYQKIIQRSNKHGVLPTVNKTIKSLAYSNKKLLDFSLLLKINYLNITKRNMLMSAELINITKLLNQHKIETIAFKGPALSQMAYGDITLRQYGDIDILIKKKDRFNMILILEKEGYIPEIKLQDSSKEAFFNAVNVIAFYKGSMGIRIEIHWELLSRNYAIVWNEKILWENSKSIQINNNKIQVLTIEHHLLYICVHSAKHLYERIEWICDIDRLIQANLNINWQYILKEAKRMGITRMLYLGLSLSKILFDLKIPKNIQKSINKDKEIPKLINKIIKINFSDTIHEEKSFNTLVLLLNMRENYTDKLKLLYKGILTPKFDDFLFYQLPKYMVFLYPILRLIRLIKKYSNSN